VCLDLALRAEPQLLLDLDLHPEALPVEAVLIAGAEALHGPVTVPQVFVGPPPGVVDAHRVVRRDLAVDEPPLRPLRVVRNGLLERLRLVPPAQDLHLQRGEVYLSRYRCEHSLLQRPCSVQRETCSEGNMPGLPAVCPMLHAARCTLHAARPSTKNALAPERD